MSDVNEFSLIGYGGYFFQSACADFGDFHEGE